MTEDNTYVIPGPPPFKPLPKESLGKLIYDRLIADPADREALVDVTSGRSISYKQILGKTCSLAASLQKNGYGKGTVFAICSENIIEYYIPVLSALYLGAIVAPLNNSYTALELTHVLNISKPKVVFCSHKVHQEFIFLKIKLKFIEKIIVLDSEDKHVDTESLNGFIEKSLGGGPPLYRFNPCEVEEDQLAFIMCSSGTTGLPKGVMITHKNTLTRYTQSSDPRYVARNRGNTALGILPFFHAYGMITTMMCIERKTKVVVMTKFEEKRFLNVIQQYKISELFLVPPLAIFLAKSPLVNDYDLSSIKQVACGAAPLNKDTEAAVKARLNVAVFRQGYGLTETTLACIAMPLNEYRDGSCGKVMPFTTVKVRDPETRKSLGPNQVGEICVKGSLVMKGYYDNRKATSEAFTSDGWLLTGDLGYYDKDGFFFIVDRLKELIKYKGFQVAPAELEALLINNPKIKDAGVVGVPNEAAGELPLAFVVKNPQADITEKEVEDYVAERLSSHKKLRGGVIFLREIPKNPSGKILRRKLRELLKEHKLKL